MRESQTRGFSQRCDDAPPTRDDRKDTLIKITDATGSSSQIGERRLLYQRRRRAYIHRRALSHDQGRRYHSDIRRIYILHERPPASSDSRTIGPVWRRTRGVGAAQPLCTSPRRVPAQYRCGADRSQGIDRDYIASRRVAADPHPLDRSTCTRIAIRAQIHSSRGDERKRAILTMSVLGGRFTVLVTPPPLHFARSLRYSLRVRPLLLSSDRETCNSHSRLRPGRDRGKAHQGTYTRSSRARARERRQ